MLGEPEPAALRVNSAHRVVMASRSGLVSGRFPFVTDIAGNTHTPYLACARAVLLAACSHYGLRFAAANLISVSTWLLISWYMASIKFFVKI